MRRQPPATQPDWNLSDSLLDLLVLEQESPGLGITTAIYIDAYELLKYFFNTFSETDGSKIKITTQHLSMAHRKSQYPTLSLLLSTLWKQDENEGKDKVKSFVQTLEESEKLTLLTTVIERSDRDTLIILLETFGEEAKQRLSVHLTLAIRMANENPGRLRFLLTTLGEEAKNMITSEHQRLAKQVNPAIFEDLIGMVSENGGGYRASSDQMKLFQSQDEKLGNKEREDATPADSSENRIYIPK